MVSCYFIYLPVCFTMRLSQKHSGRAILVELQVSEVHDYLSKISSADFSFMKDGKIDFFKTQWRKYTFDTLGHREIHKTIHICIM